MREVIVSASSVLPWNAPSKAITACLPVCSRASLTAFLGRLRPTLKNALLVPPIGASAEPFGDLDVQLVGDDGEVGVEKPVGLVVNRLHDPRVTMPHVEHADASDEVDERVAVDVRERGSPPRPQRWGVDEQWLRHGLPFTFQNRAGPRPRNLGPELDYPSRRHAPERIRGSSYGTCRAETLNLRFAGVPHFPTAVSVCLR